MIASQNVIYMLAGVPSDNYVYAPQLQALNAQTGKVLWQDRGCSILSATATARASTPTDQGITHSCYWVNNTNGNSYDALYKVLLL
ncbi:MAG TPA: hypothetical protein VGD98_20275 [Ktedonobacteraceae bacterium]